MDSLDTLYWGSHGGGFGTTFCPLLAFLSYVFFKNKKILHNCQNRYCVMYKDTVIHKFLVEHSNNCDDLTKFINNDFDYKKDLAYIHFGHDWIYNLLYKDIPKIPNLIASSGVKSKLYLSYKNAAQDNKWILDYDNNKSIIIHVRLWDEAPLSLVHKNRFPQGGAKQNRFIGESNLIRLLTYLKKTYPNHSLFICTTPNEIDINICNHIIKKSNIECKVINTPQKEIWTRNPFNPNDFMPYYRCGDEEYDIWKMLNCDILIMSKSTFSIYAGLLHQGSKVYIPFFDRDYRHFYDVGFDNSNILYF